VGLSKETVWMRSVVIPQYSTIFLFTKALYELLA